MKRLWAGLFAIAALAASPAFAQVTPSWPVGGLAGQRAPGSVALCLNSAGQAVPPALCDQSPSFAKPNRAAVASDRAEVVTISPNSAPITFAPSAAAAIGLVPATTAALASNKVIKSSAGNLYSFEVAADSTLSASAWWIMIYDATSAPVDGAVTPQKCYAMASGTTFYAAAFPTPVAFTTGITIAVSTTGCFTKTASIHAFISGDAQ